MAVSTNSSTNKYVVRQPIKDLQGKTIAYEIRFSGGQPVAVHLGHLDVRDDQGHMAREVRVPGKPISWGDIQKPDKTVSGGAESVATGIAQCGADLVTIHSMISISLVPDSSRIPVLCISAMIDTPNLK